MKHQLQKYEEKISLNIIHKILFNEIRNGVKIDVENWGIGTLQMVVNEDDGIRDLGIFLS